MFIIKKRFFKQFIRFFELLVIQFLSFEKTSFIRTLLFHTFTVLNIK